MTNRRARLQLLAGLAVLNFFATPAFAQPEQPPVDTIEQGNPAATPATPVTVPTAVPNSKQDDEDLADLEAALAGDSTEAAETAKPVQSSPIGGGIPQSMNPDISFIVDVAGAYFSKDENLQGGGHDPTENGFLLQQVELAVSKAVDSFFRLDGNIVFRDESVEVEEVYATTLDLPWNLQARIGKFLTQFGRLNSTHPHSWTFIDQPFAITRAFGGEANRGLGFEVSYLTPLPWYTEVVASITDAGSEGARSFLGEEGRAPDSVFDFESLLAVKQFFELGDDLSLMWGLSVATGPNSVAAKTRSNVYGADLFIKYRPVSRQSYTVVSLQAEYLLRSREIVGDKLWDQSGYAQVLWRFSKRWDVAGRYEYGGAAWGGGGNGRGDYLDPAWTDDRHRTSANVSFWPTEFSRVRAQASIDAPGWLSDPITAAFLQFEVTAGAHGAHKF